MQKNTIENLEFKLQKAKEENFEVFQGVEKMYKQEYKSFVDNFFTTDVLGAKKTIGAHFELAVFNMLTAHGGKKIENLSSQNKQEALNQALEKGLQILPVSVKKREILKTKILHLNKKMRECSEIFGNNTDVSRDHNYPILESLLSQKLLSQSDMISVYAEYKNAKSLRQSLKHLSFDKQELVRSYFYSLNNDKKEERVSNFSTDYKNEISSIGKNYSQNIIDGVVQFVGRNYFKLKKTPHKKESQKLKLRRTFKIALLKLLRIKYGNIDAQKVLAKVDTLSDFESLFSLVAKLIEIIPEKDERVEKYSIQETFDEAQGIIKTAESTKEKLLSGENTTVKMCSIIAKLEETFDGESLDALLDENTEIIGSELYSRESEILQDQSISVHSGNLLDGGNIENINAGILQEQENKKRKIEIENTDEVLEHDDEEISNLMGQELLEYKFIELKNIFKNLELQKQELFATGDYDKLDKINDQLLDIMIKLEKIQTILETEEVQNETDIKKL